MAIWISGSGVVLAFQETGLVSVKSSKEADVTGEERGTRAVVTGAMYITVRTLAFVRTGTIGGS